jgi:hemerythrin-like domain-containing protein
MLRNPLDIIDQAHLLQQELCDVLERIADGLPDDVDRGLCAQAAAQLKFDVPLHHRDEEEALFPQLRRRAWPSDCMDTILDRLAEEHGSDTENAAEIVEWLDHLADGKRLGNPNMVGYMLRGFFEGYRRHIHWENTLVMPVARRRLIEDDFAVIAAIMERNRAQAQ